jgi:hypothetical protein
MAAMSPRRARPSCSSIASVALVSASLVLAALPCRAAPEPDSEDAPEAAPEGPSRPPATNEGPSANGEAEGPVEGPARPEEAEAPPPDIPPPHIDSEDEPGIEFAIPPPEDEEPAPVEREPPLAVSFPDPGTAPNDGASMLVLSSTTIGLTGLALSAGLVVGLRNQTPLEWLLPSTLVPTVGVLAFAGGGLYLGIKRARAYRRWEIGYRVIGTPQGGGLMVGASFTLLAALGFVPAGAFALKNGETTLGATMIAIGSAAALATPIMFVIGGRRQRDYQRTGGWRRRPIPPLPSEAARPRLQLAPLLAPVPHGLTLGAAGRF